MNGNIIEQHNFENAKKELKKFSEQTTTELDLKQVENSKGVGEFFGDWIFGRGIGLSHKVTGEELNELTRQIQEHLTSVNNTQIKLIKEFGQVYTALEALDNDYIKAILISIKSTEETSQSIQTTQEQIKKIVENQRKTLEELKKFKQKLDGYAHLEDIDKIWNEYQKLNKEVNTLSIKLQDVSEKNKDEIKKIDVLKTSLAATEKKIDELCKQSNEFFDKLEVIIEFTSGLENLVHIKDIDEMWDSISNLKEALSNTDKEIETIRTIVVENKEEITVVTSFIEKLSGLKYLMHVDDIWSKMENNEILINKLERANEIHTEKIRKLDEIETHNLENIRIYEREIANLKEYKNQLDSISHLADVDNIWKDVENYNMQITELKRKNEMLVEINQKIKVDIDKKIEESILKNSNYFKEVSNRVKYAYWIAGGSAGLAIVEFVLLLMKVI